MRAVRLSDNPARFGDGGAIGVDGFGLGRLESRGDRRIPVEKAGTAVAGEKFALAELVPRLRADAHAAARALLVFGAGDAGAAGGGEAIEAGQQIGIDETAECFELPLNHGQLIVRFLLALGDAVADLVERAGEDFDLFAGCRQRALVLFGAFEAGVLFGFEAFNLRFGKLDFVFDGLGLGGGGDGVALGAQAGGFLLVGGGLAFQAGAEGLFAVEGVGGGGNFAPRALESDVGLGDFGG